jgi:hypothetical protein
LPARYVDPEKSIGNLAPGATLFGEPYVEQIDGRAYARRTARRAPKQPASTSRSADWKCWPRPTSRSSTELGAKPMKTDKPKGGQPLPPGAHNVPGSARYRAVQGAPRPKPVQIDEKFVSDPRGGPELVVGKRHIEVKDNRTKVNR